MMAFTSGCLSTAVWDLEDFPWMHVRYDTSTLLFFFVWEWRRMEACMGKLLRCGRQTEGG